MAAAKDERRQAADRRLRGERRGGGDRRVAQDRAALERGAPVVYEATFAADGVTVVADILERRPGAGGFAVVEVKASTRAKPEHVPDLAVQVHVLRRSGLTEALGYETIHDLPSELELGVIHAGRCRR